MIYLSDKGEVLGEFEESAVPGLLAAQKISSGAFFWREGMSEWRPVADLKKTAVAAPVPVPKPSASAAPRAAVAMSPANPVIAAGNTKPFVPRRSVIPAKKTDNPVPDAAAQPMRSTKDVLPGPAAPGGQRRWLTGALVALVLAGGAGAGVWWRINREPPVIPGSVTLSGAETSPVEIRVFRREDLAGPWREKFAAADARGAELEKLLTEAAAEHRAKKILYDEAAGVCAVGEEYNMPDVAELRADRDAKKADADAAQAELDKLRTEKETLLTMAALLQSLPPPVKTLAADSQGNFSLAPVEGEVVLLATVGTGGEGEVTAWLEVVEVAEDGTAPESLRFSETNRLDLGGIRSFAGAGSS